MTRTRSSSAMARRSPAALAMLVATALLMATSCRAKLVLPSLTAFTAQRAALHARQLVHRNEWGTLSTLSLEFPGAPFGHIVSYSDGVGYSAKNATGQLFFYLTELDAAAKNLAANPRATVTISMAQQGPHACKMDVEDPTCWKLTLLGDVRPVSKDDEDKLRLARAALFSKHPQMAEWPTNHGFSVYYLEVQTMVLLDFYGGAKQISPEEYYHVSL